MCLYVQLMVVAPGDSIGTSVAAGASKAGAVGMLLIFLPWCHEGGELIAHQGDQKVRAQALRACFGLHGWSAPEARCTQVQVDWGAALQAQSDAVQWAFLGSGTQPEFEPVAAGHQVVLVYSVSGVPVKRKLSTLVDCTASPFGCALESALCQESFLPEGGVLRFACQRIEYDYTDKKLFSSANLKGPDLAVYAAAQQLGVTVRVLRIWKNDWVPEHEEVMHPTWREPAETTEFDDGYGSDPGLVWVRRPQHYQPDPARVEVGRDWLGVGDSSCMISLYVKPFFERCRM